MRRTIVLHPFLFALFPVVFFLSRNLGHFHAAEAFVPALVSVAAASAAWLLLRVAFRDGGKAAMAVSLALLLFFSYGHMCNVVSSGRASLLQSALMKSLVFDWAALFILGVIGILKIRASFEPVTRLLNVVSLGLLVICLGGMGYELWNKRVAVLDIAGRQKAVLRKAGRARAPGERLPDVYYIVLDSYAGAETLKEQFDFDNREFISFLTQRGFFVPERTRSAYAYTSASLAAVMNMEYINYYVEHDPTALTTMASNSAVRAVLASEGYSFQNFLQTAEFTLDEPRFLDVSVDFGTALLETTMARVGMERPAEGTLYDTFRQRFLAVFEALEKVPAAHGPTFAFVHVLAVHPPYLFGPQGERLPISTAEIVKYSWEPKERYMGQLVFVNRRLERLIDILLARSSVPPVIILQADHGPDFSGRWESPDPRFLRERFRSFSAYLLPEKCASYLRDDFAPVNAFRSLFNGLFGDEREMVEGRSYFSVPNRHSKVTDVTDIVR